MDGDYAIVGSPLSTERSFGSGAAVLFELEADTWQDKGVLPQSISTSGQTVGISVSIDGDYAIAGTGSDFGNAFVFKREDGMWKTEAELMLKPEDPQSTVGEFW